MSSSTVPRKQTVWVIIDWPDERPGTIIGIYSTMEEAEKNWFSLLDESHEYEYEDYKNDGQTMYDFWKQRIVYDCITFDRCPGTRTISIGSVEVTLPEKQLIYVLNRHVVGVSDSDSSTYNIHAWSSLDKALNEWKNYKIEYRAGYEETWHYRDDYSKEDCDAEIYNDRSVNEWDTIYTICQVELD